MTIEYIIILYLSVALVVSVSIAVFLSDSDKEGLFMVITAPLLWVVWLPVITFLAVSNLITKAIISQIEVIKEKSKNK